jgi:hypothetical protein
VARVLPIAMVMVELWLGPMLDGLKVTVIPFWAVADRLAVPLNPFWAVRVIVVVAEDPWTIVRLDGLLLNEKSGWGAVMVMPDDVLMLPVCVTSPA